MSKCQELLDRDVKTYTDSNNLLNAICDFKFVFGLVVLKVILSNTDSLSKYLQGKNVDVIAAKETAEAGGGSRIFRT